MKTPEEIVREIAEVRKQGAYTCACGKQFGTFIQLANHWARKKKNPRYMRRFAPSLAALQKVAPEGVPAASIRDACRGPTRKEAGNKLVSRCLEAAQRIARCLGHNDVISAARSPGLIEDTWPEWIRELEFPKEIEAQRHVGGGEVECVMKMLAEIRAATPRKRKRKKAARRLPQHEELVDLDNVAPAPPVAVPRQVQTQVPAPVPAPVPVPASVPVPVPVTVPAPVPAPVPVTVAPPGPLLVPGATGNILPPGKYHADFYMHPSWRWDPSNGSIKMHSPKKDTWGRVYGWFKGHPDHVREALCHYRAVGCDPLSVRDQKAKAYNVIGAVKAARAAAKTEGISYRDYVVRLLE